ncbi:hypothetical protein BGW41_005802 [Actinomortierella wolfii]|nr:hypothetical protein BGW41_005802 [Actinomortierella wolfii]
MKPCPLCSGQVSSFDIADDVTVEMCSNQECIYPFNEDPGDFELHVADSRPAKALGQIEGIKRKKSPTDASTDKKKKKKKTKDSTKTETDRSSSVVTEAFFEPTPAPSELASPQMPDLTFDILSQDSTWTTPVTPPDAAPSGLYDGAKEPKISFMDVSASGIENFLFGDEPLLGTGAFGDDTLQLLEHDASLDAILQG